MHAFAEQLDKLGNAECFIFLLSQVPHFRLRVEAMLLQSELQEKCDALFPDLDALVQSACDVESNEALSLFLRYSLHTGNFINAVSIPENAVFPCDDVTACFPCFREGMRATRSVLKCLRFRRFEKLDRTFHA